MKLNYDCMFTSEAWLSMPQSLLVLYLFLNMESVLLSEKDKALKTIISAKHTHLVNFALHSLIIGTPIF